MQVFRCYIFIILTILKYNRLVPVKWGYFVFDSTIYNHHTQLSGAQSLLKPITMGEGHFPNFLCKFQTRRHDLFPTHFNYWGLQGQEGAWSILFRSPFLPAVSPSLHPSPHFPQVSPLSAQSPPYPLTELLTYIERYQWSVLDTLKMASSVGSSWREGQKEVFGTATQKIPFRTSI